MSDTFTAYITKYALTTGIFKIEASEGKSASQGLIEEVGKQWGPFYRGEGKDWHRTKEGAVARAHHMRNAKVKALGKQIDKIFGLEFYKQVDAL